MSSHSAHPETHTHGLADDCARCAEHAEYPCDSLDGVNLAQIVDRVLDGGRPARTVNERTAMARVADALRAGQKLARYRRALNYMAEREEQTP